MGDWRRPHQSSTWLLSGYPVGWEVEVESVERDKELDIQREIKKQALQGHKAQDVRPCFLSLPNSCHHHPVTSILLNSKLHLPGAPLAEELLKGLWDSLCPSRHMSRAVLHWAILGENVGLLDCPEAHGNSF